MRTSWAIFIFLLCLHQYANYELVRVLILDTLNPQRVFLIVKHITVGCDSSYTLKSVAQDNEGVAAVPAMARLIIPTPKEISRRESIYRPIWLYAYGPRLGESINVLFEVFDLVGNGTVSLSKMSSRDPDWQGQGQRMVWWDRLRRAWQQETFVIGVDRW